MNRKRIIFIGTALLTFFLTFVSYGLQKNYFKAASLPVFSAVPDFLLYDSKAKEVKLKSVKGKIFVTDFIFTTCSGLCPMMTKNMIGVYNAYKDNNGVKFLSISVNPEYDSPDILEKYAEKYNINTKRWYLLTGSREEIGRLALSGFKVGSVENPVFHSGYLILADRKAQIRGYYDGGKPAEVKKLITDIGILLKEK